MEHVENWAKGLNDFTKQACKIAGNIGDTAENY